MANYLFQDYPGTLAGGETVYAVLYNPSTIQIYNPATPGWVAANTVANASTVAVNATALQNTGIHYLQVPVSIEADSVLAKWFVGVSASKNVVTDIAIGSSGFSPPSATANVTSGDITAIANKVINMAVTAAGALDKHSLGAMVLATTNADTNTVVGKLVSRNPDTNAIVHQYDIQTGHGQPIRSIT